METDEFIEITNRLEKYYEKEYTNEQLKIMHEELKDFKVDRYKILVSEAIKRCKFLPKVADIIQIDKEIGYKNLDDEVERIECKKCGGTGIIVYKKKIQDGLKEYYYDFAAVCDCGNFKQYKGWESKENKSNYYTPMAKELNLI